MFGDAKADGYNAEHHHQDADPGDIPDVVCGNADIDDPRHQQRHEEFTHTSPVTSKKQ
jgi:hypothetical protein